MRIKQEHTTSYSNFTIKVFYQNFSCSKEEESTIMKLKKKMKPIEENISGVYYCQDFKNNNTKAINIGFICQIMNQELVESR